MAKTEQIPEDRGGKAGHDFEIGKSFNQTAGIVSPELNTTQQHHQTLQLPWKGSPRVLPLPPNSELNVDKLEGHAETTRIEVGSRSIYFHLFSRLHPPNLYDTCILCFLFPTVNLNHLMWLDIGMRGLLGYLGA